MTTTINNEHKKLNVPNLRFPEFQGEWEKCKLGDLCNVLMCKRILASQTNTEEGVPFIKLELSETHLMPIFQRSYLMIIKPSTTILIKERL